MRQSRCLDLAIDTLESRSMLTALMFDAPTTDVPMQSSDTALIATAETSTDNASFRRTNLALFTLDIGTTENLDVDVPGADQVGADTLGAEDGVDVQPIVFVGGYGAASYQYANGTYDAADPLDLIGQEEPVEARGSNLNLKTLDIGTRENPDIDTPDGDTTSDDAFAVGDEAAIRGGWGMAQYQYGFEGV